MRRRIILPVLCLLLLLTFMSTPDYIAHARAITFERNGTKWAINITMCQNGFKVQTTGGIADDVAVEIRLDEVSKIVPDNKVTYLLHDTPVQYTSPTGTNLIAATASAQVQIVTTNYFYFKEMQAVKTNIRTAISGFVGGKPFTFLEGTGFDLVQNCVLPAPAPPTVDLSGVYDPLAFTRDFGKDGRASPDAGDKVAIYCVNEGASAGTLVVMAIDRSVRGYRLGEFKLNDVDRASPRAVSKLAVDGRSLIMMQTYGPGYRFEWTGGPWSAREIKYFTCDWFGKGRYNKTSSQLKYPDAFGNDGRVAPDQTDKMVVYCNVGPRTIAVLGIDKESKGFNLATFNYDELLKASPEPIAVDTKPFGKVTLRVDNDDNFYLEWFNGLWSTYEWKAFKCRF